MNLSSHHKRLLTAAVLVPVVFGSAFLGGWWLFAMLLAVSLLGLWEYYSLFWPANTAGQGLGKKLAGLTLAVLFFLAAKTGNPELIIAVMVLCLWFSNLLFLWWYSRRPDESHYANLAILASGLLYIPFVVQYGLHFRPVEVFLVILAAAATDVGGYYGGSLMGGPKIWPVISPKKTWAGSLVGLVACVIFTVVYGKLLGVASAWVFLLLGVCLNIAGQLGDFFESALKRRLGVKDSGNLLPGHGGILDRMDGLLLITPVYAAARALHTFFA